MDELLDRLMEDCRPCIQEGKVASYIPELQKADPQDFGACILNCDGKLYAAGEYEKPFTIQSVVKPLLLLLALMDNGAEAVQHRVGVEATGKPFDAINVTDQALLSQHLNPMVNMGAIVMITLLRGNSYEERFNRLLAFTRKLACNPTIQLNEDVYRSEKLTGNKNRSLGYLLKAYGMIQDDVEEVLDCYFKACSLNVTARDLASIGMSLANHGRLAISGKRVYASEYAYFVNAVLMTCGMYDGSGEFAVRVGVPAKSGVGGGIMAVAPTRMSIGLYSPALDSKGNSVAGIRMLEKLSRELYLSIF